MYLNEKRCTTKLTNKTKLHNNKLSVLRLINKYTVGFCDKDKYKSNPTPIKNPTPIQYPAKRAATTCREIKMQLNTSAITGQANMRHKKI
ncbi:hypothetical protein TUM19329_06430 [Legionella antarctica]|uniref:Uncharacterized protein n=1 Tax=Legionella antarctica TaxID=2708020 RepID=A0A6F8T2P1_9GAMM|nr:hypothetical protein TUM19329_06430 [Legionella antarctica]